jgi:hypothetical protein
MPRLNILIYRNGELIADKDWEDEDATNDIENVVEMEDALQSHIKANMPEDEDWHLEFSLYFLDNPKHYVDVSRNIEIPPLEHEDGEHMYRFEFVYSENNNNNSNSNNNPTNNNSNLEQNQYIGGKRTRKGRRVTRKRSGKAKRRSTRRRRNTSK